MRYTFGSLMELILRPNRLGKALVFLLLISAMTETASAMGYFWWFGSIYFAGPYPLNFSEVKNADAATFKALKFGGKDSVFAKDKARAFCWDQEIVGVDVETFVPIGPEYAVDKGNVYFYREPIPNADPKSFVVLSHYYGKDRSRGYRETRPFDVKNVESLEFPINFYKEVDPGFARNNELYVRDNSDYYYFSFPNVVPMNVAFPDYLKIVDLNSNSTEDGLWTSDGSYWYCDGRRVPVADQKSFRILNYSRYSTDGIHVYYVDLIVDSGDPSTFAVDDHRNAKDKNHLYFRNKIRSGSD